MNPTDPPTAPDLFPILLLVLGASVAPLSVSAQIATDRPDFVESAATVGAGALQLETSLAYARTGPPGLRQAAWTTPTLLRVGVATHLELRLESDGWIRDASPPGLGSQDGMADLAVGLKWHTSDQRRGLPGTALLLHADLPSGAASHRGEGVRPSLRAVGEWTLPRGFSLGVMPGLVLDDTDEGRHLAGLVGAVVALELSRRLRGFAEISYERIAAERYGGTAGTVNTGMAFLVSPHVQIDGGVSWGVTDGAPDFSATAGLSLLRPGR